MSPYSGSVADETKRPVTASNANTFTPATSWPIPPLLSVGPAKQDGPPERPGGADAERRVEAVEVLAGQRGPEVLERARGDPVAVELRRAPVAQPRLQP